MNYKKIISYIAYLSDSNSKIIDELEIIYAHLKKKYTKIELSIYCKFLIENLNNSILYSENNLNVAVALGNANMSYDFLLEGERFQRNLIEVVNCWKTSIYFIEEKMKSDKSEKLLFDFEILPDYLTPEELKDLMRWTEATIATKHSKGELACVEGTRLTPKKGLQSYLEKRTKGLIDDPALWFDKDIHRKKK